MIKVSTDDQRGLIGVIELGLVGVLLVVIGFTGTRIYNATRQADQDHQDSVKVAEASNPDFSKEEELTEEKDQPKEDDSKNEETEPASKPAEDEDEKNEEDNKKDDDNDEPDYIELGYGGMEATDDAFKFTASFGSSRSGYCKVKLFKGEEYIYQESDNFSNKTSCTVTLPKDSVPESGEWRGYVKLYDGDDKLIGYTNEFEVTLTL